MNPMTLPPLSHRLDVSKIVVVELHDRYAHYFGRKEVSHEVLAAFAARNFVNYTDGEHTVYLRQHQSSVGTHSWGHTLGHIHFH